MKELDMRLGGYMASIGVRAANIPVHNSRWYRGFWPHVFLAVARKIWVAQFQEWLRCRYVPPCPPRG